MNQNNPYPLVIETKRCTCSLTTEAVFIQGTYARNNKGFLTLEKGQMEIPLSDVLRVGMTTTYDKKNMVAFMLVGLVFVFTRFFPLLFTFSEVFYGLAKIVQSMKGIQSITGLLFLVMVVYYFMSFQKLLEFNTIEGRFVIPDKHINKAQLEAFQYAFESFKYKKF